jgi:hypothetical protein
MLFDKEKAGFLAGFFNEKLVQQSEKFLLNF